MTIQTPDTRGPWDQRKAEAAAAGLAPVIPIRVESMPMLRIEGTLIVHRHIDPAEGALIEVQVDPEGDWIIKGVQGEFYPCKPDIFEATYEAVS